jgi:hypothetical protein
MYVTTIDIAKLKLSWHTIFDLNGSHALLSLYPSSALFVPAGAKVQLEAV